MNVPREQAIRFFNVASHGGPEDRPLLFVHAVRNRMAVRN